MKRETDVNPAIPLWVTITFGAGFVVALLGALTWYVLTYGHLPGF